MGSSTTLKQKSKRIFIYVVYNFDEEKKNPRKTHSTPKRINARRVRREREKSTNKNNEKKSKSTRGQKRCKDRRDKCSGSRRPVLRRTRVAQRTVSLVSLFLSRGGGDDDDDESCVYISRPEICPDAGTLAPCQHTATSSA